MDDAKYDKRYANRNRIITPFRPIWMSVPKIRNKNFLQTTKCPTSPRWKLGRNYFETLAGRTNDASKGNRRIERSQTAGVRHRQGQEVDVRYLSMSLNMTPLESSVVSEAYPLPPESVIAGPAEPVQTLDGLVQSWAISDVGRATRNPNKCAFRHGATRWQRKLPGSVRA